MDDLQRRNLIRRLARELGHTFDFIEMVDDFISPARVNIDSPNGILILSRHLIEHLNESELKAVIAHEVGHLKTVHGKINILWDRLNLTAIKAMNFLLTLILVSILIAIMAIFIPSIIELVTNKAPGEILILICSYIALAGTALVLITLLAVILFLASTICQPLHSRLCVEHAADRYAAKHVSTQAIIGALKKIKGYSLNEAIMQKDDMTHIKPVSWGDIGGSLSDTHPSLNQRIKALTKRH